MKLLAATNLNVKSIKQILMYFIAVKGSLMVVLLALCVLASWAFMIGRGSIVDLQQSQEQLNQVIAVGHSEKIAQINDLQNQVDNIAKDIKTAQQHDAKKDTAFSNELQHIQARLEKIISQVSEQLPLTDLQIKSLQQQILELQERLKPKKYLAQSELPFQVVSMDFWNGVPLVSVTLDGHNALMAVNEQRAGWRLTQLAISQGRAIFADNHKHQVKIDFGDKSNDQD